MGQVLGASLHSARARCPMVSWRSCDHHEHPPTPGGAYVPRAKMVDLDNGLAFFQCQTEVGLLIITVFYFMDYCIILFYRITEFWVSVGI